MSIRRIYMKSLRGAVSGLAAAAGAAIVAMMLVICADVLLRAAGRPIAGSYDIVRILSVVVIVCALPYTTAVKGHVAVELLLHKLPGRGRAALDAVNRALVLVLFGLLAVYNVRYGLQLKASGELMATLPIPVYWIPWVITGASGVVVLVISCHMLHPEEELIKS